jgi:hypothetical protein
MVSKPCDAELSCASSGAGAGFCAGAPSGSSCVTVKGCLDEPLCLEGKCSPLPPAVVSACSAAVKLEVPSQEDAPDGVTLATSFEPGEAIVSPVIDSSVFGPGNAPCELTPAGPERVITLNIAASPHAKEQVHLVVDIEGLDATVVSHVAGVALDKCGDPRSVESADCAQSTPGPKLIVPVGAIQASVVSIVLQSTDALTKSVPFTVRAKLAPASMP